jgi:folylpolyglutamate synthase/dihydropteroate synthase
MNLNDFLASKPLFYDVIDYERFPKSVSRDQTSFLANPKIIHLVGTNGKGSTGRFLATALSPYREKGWALHLTSYSCGLTSVFGWMALR